MIDRNNVAREKLARAAELMEQNGVDLWVFYSRQKQDPALELMFNTSVQEEVLLALTRGGERCAFVPAALTAGFEATGLYTQVIAADSEQIMPAFKRLFDAQPVQKLALNESPTDSRCDGIGLGLYRKLCGCIGEDVMKRVRVSSFPMLEELRAVKTPSEIDIMVECNRLTTDIYDALFAQLHIGLSETEIGDLMIQECLKRGVGNALGDPTEYPLVLLVKGGMFHRGPDAKNVVEAGDMLVIDFSIRYNGYTSDVARTLYFLRPGEEHAPQPVQDCVNAAVGAVSACSAFIKPGVLGYQVDEVGRGSIVASGYPAFPHSTGHQVGLEVHDGGTALSPKGRPGCERALRVNEIYALEPTVLQDIRPDGTVLPCAIVEDDWLVTETGCRLINPNKRQLAVIEIPYREA
ncbi:MAG: M24 family metallopeptidase [Eubacteriales bacterium]|nr:M24 family metallopeptidase [Eubacteriales bacterium]